MRIFQVLHDSHGQRPEGGQGGARVEEENCAGVILTNIFNQMFSDQH